MNLRPPRGFVLLLLALAWPVGPARGAPPAGATASTAPATPAAAGAYQVEIVIFRAAAPPAGGEDLSASAEGFAATAAGKCETGFTREVSIR